MGLPFPFFFVLILKWIQRRSSTLKLQNKRISYNGFCTDVFYVLLGEKKKKEKNISGPFLVLLFSFLSFLLLWVSAQTSDSALLPGARRVKFLPLRSVSVEAGVTLIKDLAWGGMDFLRQPEGSNSSLRFQSMSRGTSGNSFSEQSEVFACPYSRLAHNPKHKLVASQLEIWHFAEPPFAWELIIKHSFSFKKIIKR